MKEVVYLIVGNGRLASHWRCYFQGLGQPFLQWSRRDPGGETLLTDYLAEVTHVLLLISDDAIENFIETHPAIKQKIVIHCSGCLVTPWATGAHPLMTFSVQLYDMATYLNMPLVLEAEGPDFNILFPRLQNPHIKISRQDKPLYHALCVMGNNFTTILWQKVFSMFEEKIKIPSSFLFPIMTRTIENMKNDPANSLTGPLARGDQTTIQKNLNSLSNDPFQAVYQAFVSAFQLKN